MIHIIGFKNGVIIHDFATNEIQFMLTLKQIMYLYGLASRIAGLQREQIEQMEWKWKLW